MFLVRTTTSWKIEGAEIPQEYWKNDKPFILAVWHGRLLMVAPHWPKEKLISALISSHRDGELITRTISWFKFGSVRGSSNDGEGIPALIKVVRNLKNGTSIVFTPDGPRGPRMRAGEGIISAAKLSGVPIIPFSVSSKKRKVMNSWDRFVFPFPFSHGSIVWGKPISIPRNASDDEIKSAILNVENTLTEVTQMSDKLTGHEPIAPTKNINI